MTPGKPHTVASGETPADARERFMWHLRPLPGGGEFDRAHWWVGLDVDPVAALYELARRNPLVGDRMTGSMRHAPPAIVCLAQIGLKPWPKLSAGEKNLWKTFAGALKGVDCRNDEEKCFSVNWQGDCDPLRQVMRMKSGETPLPPHALDGGIGERAIAAYHQGYVLIAVAPDLAQEEAKRLLAERYREHRAVADMMKGAGKNRARHGNWLDLIAEFEQDAATKYRAKAEVFKRYRRAVEGVDFNAGR